MSQKMRDVLRESRNAFDFILMDSPPVIAVSDAAVLSVLCDGVLLVFNGQQTTTGSAQRAVERLERVGASILGVILNGIDIRDPDYDDYRSYYPSYYASVQAETKPTNKGSDGIVQNVEDVARVMEAAGVHGVKAESVPEFERKGEASSQDGKRLVPRHFFDRMVLSLSEPLGPVAHDVVKHQVSALQESMESFPLSRVWELAQLVSQEILDNRQKVRFLRSMSEEIRSLQSI
jgi:hypothetical protein